MRLYFQSRNAFSQDYNLTSHTTREVCVNVIHELPDLQFNFDSER